MVIQQLPTRVTMLKVAPSDGNIERYSNDSSMTAGVLMNN